VEEEAMMQGAYYFRHTYEVAPESALTALMDLAAGRKPVLDTTGRQWLIRRGLVTEYGDLSIPVLGTFMRRELELSSREPESAI
jgi:hypothetical protein